VPAVRLAIPSLPNSFMLAYNWLFQSNSHPYL
jgi:hypothetical protein